MLLLTDLLEAKSVMEIDPRNTTGDKIISLFIEQASSWIQEFLGRDLEKKSRTEYYKGTGTEKLLLKSRPVFTDPTIQVWVDPNHGNFGAGSDPFPANTEITYGDGFTLEVDQDDGSSRCAILWRLRGRVWPKPTQRIPGMLTPYLGPDCGSIKVTYTAGYTTETTPAFLRLAANTAVARLKYFFPLALEIGSESYEERSISMIQSDKNSKSYVMSTVAPMLVPYMRNWTW